MENNKKAPTHAQDKTPEFQGYVVNEKGEEVPITEEMMADSMRKVKLQSIGAHTGYTKAVTAEMVAEHAED